MEFNKYLITKILAIGMIGSFTTIGCNAQGIKNWISQKASEKQYMLQQIAALKIYIEYGKKGYKIAQKGLNQISEIKNGHFFLDTTYFNSLKAVNPKVLKYYQIYHLNELTTIISSRLTQIDKLSNNRFIHADERKYIAVVLSGVRNLTNSNLKHLTNILTSGRMQMSDDERIHQIDTISAAVKDTHFFLESFLQDIFSLAAQRESEAGNLHTLNTLHE